MEAHRNEEVVELLAQAARSNRLVIFIGSGVPAEYGLPSWAALTKELHNPDPDLSDLPGEFSRFVARNGTLALVELLERKLGKRPAEIMPATRRLLEVRSAALVSTNCDRTLETAARQLGAPIRVFTDDADLIDFHSTPALRVVKLHGSLDRPDSLTFTREQYQSIAHRTPSLHRRVAELMTYCRVLFLGFSMADPDFHRLMTLTGEGHPDRISQMVGLFPRAELDGSWRRIVLDEKVRLNAPLLEIANEDYGDTPSEGLVGFLQQLRSLVSPESLPSLAQQCVIFTNGYTATLKTEVTSYLANCLGIPVLATHRYGRCTSDGLLDPDLRGRRYEELISDAESIVGRGYSVVLDGTFADSTWRDRVYEIAKNRGARVIVLRTCCEDEAYIRARLWRRRLDHSRSEHEVTRFENFSLTYAEVTDSPVEADSAVSGEDVDLVTFDNNGDRAVRTSPDASADAEMVAELIRISPLMSSSI